MPTYKVYFEQMASTVVTVEADDPESAMDKAYERTPSGLCAHCSGAFGTEAGVDLSGDWEIREPSEDVVEVTP